MIRFDQAVIRYRGASVPAVRGVSLTAAPGTMTAVVGPNGSGKSTLVRALLSVLMASFIVGAALLRTRLSADVPFDLMALLLRTAALAFVIRAGIAIVGDPKDHSTRDLLARIKS